MNKYAALILILIAFPLFGQKPVSPGGGSGGGGGGGTAYMSAGTFASLPATCTPGGTNALYVATDQTEGDNLYACAATNVYTKVPYDVGVSGALVKTCAGGGAACTFDIDPNVVPTLNSTTNVFTNGNDFSGASLTAMLRLDDADAPTCDDTIGEMYFNTVTKKAMVCSAADTWTELAPAPTIDIDWDYITSLNIGFTAVVTIDPTGGSANRVRYLKFAVRSGITIFRFQFWHHTNGAAGATAGVGIYDHAGNLLAQSGALAADSGAASVKGATLGSPVYLAPGSYYWAWGSNDTAVRQGGFTVSTLAGVYTPSTGVTADTTTMGNAANTYDIATGMPATLGTLTNITTLNVPLIVAFGQAN